MIVCESCQEKLATVHLTEIVQKAKRELHLCETCAQARGVVMGQPEEPAQPKPAAQPGSHSSNQPNQAQGKPGKPLSVKELFAGLENPASVGGSPKRESVSCPDCGIGLDEFRTSGRLGCARDYDHFRAELEPLLERIHGAGRHVGRVPDRLAARLAVVEQVELYQRELAAAVEREAYEEAAELRDKIRELEASS